MSKHPRSHPAAVALFTAVLDITHAEAVALADEGHTNLEEIAYVPLDELFQVKHIERPRLLEIRARAERCMALGGRK